MTRDIVFAGVGGQGVLSLAAILAHGALAEGLVVKQSEVHGMSQRGGSVVAHLRIADREIASDMVPAGTADLVLATEPLEGLRVLGYLSERGAAIFADILVPAGLESEDTARLDRDVQRACGRDARVRVVQCDRIARESGHVRAANTVLLGVAAGLLPIDPLVLERRIEMRFAGKAAAIVDANLAAFRAGLAIEVAEGAPNGP